MLQMPTYFEREVAKLRAMIDEPINQQFVEKQIDNTESIYQASYSNLVRERKA